jgi:hypothetical protein
VIERRTHVGAYVAAWLDGGGNAIFGAPTWARRRREPAQAREITAPPPVFRRKTAIRDPN